MFTLTPLPYPADALEPVVSATTLNTHHGKHHAKYVETTNALLKGKPAIGDGSLEAVVREAARSGEKKLFNNAAQAWNHGFFWQCMTPGYAAPAGDLLKAIDHDLGGLEALRETFITEGVNHFASGWVWLIHRDGKLNVISTHDADDTLTHEGVTPLLVCDLWEHAYYLDHKQDRKGFLEAWFDTLANWAFAADQLAAARAGQSGWRYPAPANA